MAPSSRGYCHWLQPPPGAAGSAKDRWRHAAWSTPAGNVYRADHVALAPPPHSGHTRSPQMCTGTLQECHPEQRQMEIASGCQRRSGRSVG